MNLTNLKSGTDIRGIALGEKNQLTADVVKRLTFGFVSFLSEKVQTPPQALRVSVGHDCRISSEEIKKNVIEMLLALGVRVFDCRLSSTPAMFLSTIRGDLHGSVQITASHHPFDKNGLKFFTKEGGLEGEEISRLIAIAEKADALPSIPIGRLEKLDFMDEYAAILREMICRGVGARENSAPLKGFSIAVDAGNGVGGFYAKKVLAPLGADISASQFLEPDGNFPNHAPNPENPEAMDAICRAVKENSCDLGIIFDTDVDRAAIVDETGREINRNRLIALISAILLEEESGATIVTDSVTSVGLTDFIQNVLGGVHCRFKRGYKNVINEAIRQNAIGNSCPLAIETSGHAALRENFFLDDGAYLVTKLLIKAASLRGEGKKLGDLIAGLKEPAEEKEIRYALEGENWREKGEKILNRAEEYGRKTEGVRVADDSREGVRLYFEKEKTCLTLRISVHDPILVVNGESEETGGTEKILPVMEKLFFNMN